MKKYAVVFLFTMLFVQMQAKAVTERFIEVTGSAEIEVVPDEIRFIITIQEYWEEEFEKKSKPEDYRTKVPIQQIEDQLLKALNKIGVKKEDITIQEVGNYWREKGRDFLLSKKMELKLTDFAKVDEILRVIDTRGINQMQIGELKNKDIASYREKGKIEALKAARNKASVLVSSLGKELGDVISVIEPDETPRFYGQAQYMSSNMILDGGGATDSVDNIRKIKLRYEMKARFEIK